MIRKSAMRTFAIPLLVGVGLLSFSLNAYAISTQPVISAIYTDSLATKLNSADTSMTLVRGTDAQGRALSGTYGFTIDEGTGSQEFVIGTASGSSITSLIRGVDVQTATSTVAANKFTHVRGASVKITTYPSLGIINNQLAGTETIPNPLKYNGIATTTLALDRNNLANVGIVQDAVISGAGIINASASNKGLVQLAVGSDIANSTAAGSSGALLVIPASLATTTRNSATAVNVIPITGSGGQIDGNFISTSTTRGMYPFNFPSSVGASSTVPASNGLGATTWVGFNNLLDAGAGAVSATDSATTTLYAGTIPANTLGTGNIARITLKDFSLNQAGQDIKIYLGYGGATTTFWESATTVSGKPLVGDLVFTIRANGATNAQKTSIRGVFSTYPPNSSNGSANFGTAGSFASTTSIIATSTMAVDSTQSQPFLISTWNNVSGSSVADSYAYTEILRQ